MKATVLIPSRSGKKTLKGLHCNELITESNEEPFFSGSFTIPPTPQKSVAAFPVQKLVNYLSRNRHNWDGLELRKLDLLTLDVMCRKDDSELLRLLKSHGWNGSRFVFVEEDRIEALGTLLQDLSNLYLKQKSLHLANRLVEVYGDEDCNSAFSQLASFSPNLLLNYLVSNQGLSSSCAFTFTGACMLVDISGFSAFSGSMCLQGVSGLDGLREITNGFLGHFVKKVYEFDGDVISFAGDALICVFFDHTPSSSTASTSSTAASYRALECACSLRTYKNEHLSTHIAVSYGEMKYALLGGLNDQWIGVMNGPCVSELSEAISLAASQEVVATNACIHNALSSLSGYNEEFVHEQSARLAIDCTNVGESNCFKINSVRPLTPQVKRGADLRLLFHRTSSRIKGHNGDDEKVLIERLTSVVPRPIVNAVYTGTLNYVGELRQVTTMFLSLDSFDAAIHHDPLTLQPFVQVAQHTLHESGGFLRQFLVDDKGCVLIAMWGTPSFTYSNNCSRSLYCAAQLMQRAKAVGHICSIGITTGIVFCGCVGTVQRRDYVGIGSDVNMAARLMSKAHGRILIDDNTFQSLDDSARGLFIRAEEMTLKGAIGPCAPYQYSSETIPNLSALDNVVVRNQMLKRNVMALIAKRLDLICNDGPSRSNALLFSQPSYPAYFTVLLAPLGNGNFAADYFRHCARKRGLSYFSVLALPGAKHSPYFVIKQLFLDLVGHEHFQTESQQRFVIEFLVNQAFHRSREQERRVARTSLELMLGVEWIQQSEIDAYNSHHGRATNTSPYRAFESSDDLIKLQSTQQIRAPGDLSFYKVLLYLLKKSPTALVIENAQHCDELSWNELKLISMGKDINISVLITMKASSSGGASGSVANSSVFNLIDRMKQSTVKRGMLLSDPSSSKQSTTSLQSIKVNLDPSLRAVAETVPVGSGALPFAHAQSTDSLCPTETTSAADDNSGVSPPFRSPHGDLSPLPVNPSMRSGAPQTPQLSSLFTNRMESISPPPSTKAGMTTMFLRNPASHSRPSLGSISYDSYQTDTSLSPNPYSSPDQRRLSIGSAITIYTPNNNAAGSGLLPSRSTTAKKSSPTKSAHPVDGASPFRETAAKFGLDFIPTESCRYILDNPQTAIVKIAGLTEVEVESMLCAALNVAHVSSELIKLVLDISSGNAYWCKQIVRFIQEQGVEMMERTIQYGLTRYNPLKLLILLRLEKLSTEQQLVLKIASIIGEEFNEKLMASLLPAIMQVNVMECLEALMEHDFLTKSEELFSFHNQIIQDTLYELLPPSDAAVIHGEIARWIEKTHQSDLRPRYPSLAYHFRCAGNCREEACKYAVKAADYALSRGAFNDGLTFAVAAVECATSRGELRLLLQVIDQAIVELGDGEALVVVMDGDDECWTFRSLGEQIRLELDKLKALRKASMQTMVVDTDTAQSLHSPVDSLGTATNQSSPLSPIHLSWKPSYSNLAKSRTATSEDRLPSADILVGDCQGVCCVIS